MSNEPIRAGDVSAEPAEARAVAVAELDGRLAAVRIVAATRLQVRDLADGQLLREIALPDRPHTLITTQLHGAGVAVTISGTTVRVWDLATGTSICRVRTDRRTAGAAPGIYLVAAATPSEFALNVLDGRPVVLATASVGAGGDAHTLLVYDLATGEPWRAYPAEGYLMGTCTIDGHAVALLNSPLTYGRRPVRRVRAYDLTAGEWCGELPTWGPLAVCADLTDRPLVVTDNGRDLQVWDLATGTQRCGPLPGQPAGARTLATGLWQDRPIVASTAWGEDTARTWDLTTGQPVPIDRLVPIRDGSAPREITTLTATDGGTLALTAAHPGDQLQSAT